MDRREFLKFLGLSATGALLASTPPIVMVMVLGKPKVVQRITLANVVFCMGLPVLFRNGVPVTHEEDLNGATMEMTGSIEVGQNKLAAWIIK